MSKSNSVNNRGIGVFGLLGVVFVTLKLCGVISWSWWWVTLPFWGGLVVIFTILFLSFLGYLVFAVLKR